MKRSQEPLRQLALVDRLVRKANESAARIYGVGEPTAARRNFKREEQALLLDFSGSMTRQVEPGVQAIDRLKREVKELQWTGHTVCFATRPFTVHPDELSSLAIGDRHMGHLTNLTPAFRDASTLGAKHIILVTDGRPTDPNEALKAIRELGLLVDVIFIAAPGADTPQFLKDLAKESGGSSTNVNLETQRSLTFTVRGLLT